MKNLAYIESKNYPKDLCCPISLNLMVDPVIIDDCHTYDRENIKKWLEINRRSPITNQNISSNNLLIKNTTVKKIIDSWKENNLEKKEFYLENNIAKYKDNDEVINCDNIKLNHNDFTYNGQIINGKLSGKGTLISSNNDKYIGEFINNKKHGKGIMTYNNGDIYDGDWHNNIIQGKGIMTYKNGDIYDGDWLNEKKSGKGIIKYRSGDIYDGEWCNDFKNGSGIFKKLLVEYIGVFSESLDSINFDGVCKGKLDESFLEKKSSV